MQQEVLITPPKKKPQKAPHSRKKALQFPHFPKNSKGGKIMAKATGPLHSDVALSFPSAAWECVLPSAAWRI